MVLVDRRLAFEFSIKTRGIAACACIGCLYNLLSYSSMTGSDSSTTDYPGKVPYGVDLPSDVANENLEKENP